jgi:predicted Zn-ribbon and HTH transcriptional regulator
MHTESGTCPECKSLNIEYGDIMWCDLNLNPSIEQECTCLDCGCEFKEYHNTTYTNSDVMRHGKTHKYKSNNP